MKIIIRNSVHVSSTSHDCLIAEIKGKKIKIPTAQPAGCSSLGDPQALTFFRFPRFFRVFCFLWCAGGASLGDPQAHAHL
jgi:hypothetical protein